MRQSRKWAVAAAGLSLAIVVALLLPQRDANAATASINVAEDTYVSENSATANRGSWDFLSTNAGPGERRAYLKFNVTGVSAGSTDFKASLRVYAQASSSATFTILTAPTTWSQSTLTWNNQPALGTVITTKAGMTTGYNTIDVSSYVKGNGTYALVIRKSTTSELYFTSKEASTNRPAQLVATWTPPSTSSTTSSSTTSSTSTTSSSTTTSSTTSTTVPNGTDPVLAAVGDIACKAPYTVTSTTCRHADVAQLLTPTDVNTVQLLGDIQYENATYNDFMGSYNNSWGVLKPKTHPAPGNHEYQTPNGAGYYQYFGAAAGDPTKGYYSYNVGAWHVAVLNGEIATGAGSAQEQWFRADLAANPTACSIAVWHEPLYTASDANSGPDTSKRALFQAAYDGGVDIVLNGHRHNYQRFAPMNANGALDSSRGVREFVVGTGGKSLYSFQTTAANTEERNASSFGVLRLTLHSNSYDWRFVPVAGSTYTDTGTYACH